MPTTRIFLCIGGNLGDRLANLEETRDFIMFNFGDIINTSSIYESEPWGMEDAPSFYNQVLEVDTELSPKQIAQEIIEIDEFYGREKKDTYTSREMDVDLLFFGEEILEEPLVVPHPRLHLRNFVLVPLNEIAPDFNHPLLHKKIATLLKESEDKGVVKMVTL